MDIIAILLVILCIIGYIILFNKAEDKTLSVVKIGDWYFVKCGKDYVGRKYNFGHTYRVGSYDSAQVCRDEEQAIGLMELFKRANLSKPIEIIKYS